MSKKIKIPSVLFVAACLCLYILIFSVGGNIVRYAVVLLSFIFAAIYVSDDHNSYFTVGALLFTLAADYCLVLCEPREQLWGMLFFSVVQMLYACRIHKMLEAGRLRIIPIFVRVVCVVIVEGITVFVAGDAFDMLAAVSMFYFTNIVINAIFACLKINAQPLFAIGMLLFLACDVFVGLNCAVGVYFQVPDGSILYQMAHLRIDMVWLFYVPSQAMISLSSVQGNSFIKRLKKG